MDPLSAGDAQALQLALLEQCAELKRARASKHAFATAGSTRKRPRDDDDDVKPVIRRSPPPPSSQLSEPHAGSWRARALALAYSEGLQLNAPVFASRLYAVATGHSALNAGVASEQRVPKAEPWLEGYERFANGRLFLTATPGRLAADAPNCIGLGDVLRKESMRGMWMSTFILEPDFLMPFLPVEGSGPHSVREVPLHISSDINNDLLVGIACERAGLPIQDKRPNVSKEHLEAVAAELYDLHRAMVGPNWQAAYRYVGGCSHSKAFVVEYPGWLLVVITSSNTMRCDMELSDNHWYVQSFKKLAAHARGGPETDFERHLFAHMEALGCPASFLARLRGKYDFGTTTDRVHLVASTPHVKRFPTCDDYGAFRLGALARRFIPREERHDVVLEFCCGSVGKLDTAAGWMKRMDRVLRGRNPLRAVEVDVAEMALPRWRIVFPTSDTVKACEEEVRVCASNIGCSVRKADWAEAPAELRSLFHDYESKDHGRLFHEKAILWQRPPRSSSGPAPPPYMAYFGSHNLSQTAWGTPALEPASAKSGAPAAYKLAPGAANIELGVVIRGEDLAGMLEPGSSWDDIISYVMPARPYRSGERAWNSPAWVRGKEEEEE
ncbi:hypothetical protein JCM3770_004094 [Rhodotorula araucariae]